MVPHDSSRPCRSETHRAAALDAQSADDSTRRQPTTTRRRVMCAGATAATAAIAGCSTEQTESTPPTQIDSWPPDSQPGNKLVTRTYYPEWIDWADERFKETTGVYIQAEYQPLAWRDRPVYGDGIVGDLRRWWDDINNDTIDGPRRRVDVVSLRDWRLDSARDRLHPLPVDRMPGWEHVRPRFRDVDFYQSDGGTYGVPVEGTIAALTYNTDRFDAPPDSWELLFDSEFTSQAVCTDPVRFTHLAAQYLGQNPRSPDDFGAIRAVLETHRDRLATQSDADLSTAVDEFFVTDAEAIEAFASGRAVLGSVGMAPMYVARFGRGIPIDYTAPAEGALFSAFFFGVPEEAPNPLAATRFVDWALRPPHAAQLSARQQFMPTVDLSGAVPEEVASFFEWPSEWSLRYDDPRTTDDVEVAYGELLSEVYDYY